MSRKKELIFNTIIIGIGKFSTQIISILLLPLYTSILSTEEYGTYDLIITIATFVVPCITLLMEESMFRFLIDAENKEDRKKVISQTFIYTIISTLIFSAIIFILGKILNIEYILLLIIYIISSIILALRNSILRGMGKIKSFSIINAITSISIILLNIFFIVYLRSGYKGLIYSAIISNILTSIIIFISVKVYKYVSFKEYNFKLMKEMIKYSIPLVPNSISWTVINLSDRLVISTVCGTGANGIYSMVNKFPSFIDTIYSFFYTAWKESAAKALKDTDSTLFYNNIYNVLKRFMSAIIIGMIAYLPFVFPLLVKSDFGEAYKYIPLLLIAMYFSNMSGFIGGIFTAYKNTKILGTTTIIAAFMNLLINILLVNYIGIWAGVISTFLSTIIVYILRVRKLNKYIRIKDLFNLGMYPMLAIAFIIYYSKNSIVQIVGVVIITIYAIYINKEVILVLIKEIKSKLYKKNNN